MLLSDASSKQFLITITPLTSVTRWGDFLEFVGNKFNYKSSPNVDFLAALKTIIQTGEATSWTTF